jgi:hypothetical protein
VKQTYLICLAGCLLIAPAVQAQLNPDPDNVGIFFDTEATVNCIEVIGTPIECYIIIIAPSEPSGIGGMEAYFEIPSWVFFLGLNCPGNIIPPPNWPDFQIVVNEPWPAAPSVVICSFNLFTTVPTPAFLTIHDASYYAGDDLEQVIPLDPTTHYDAFGNPNPVAGINVGADMCPVFDEGTTWGALKALYH